MSYRILSAQEATPLLLDRRTSPVVAFDTEWDIETGKLRGASMAGGTPETGFFGCFWSFDPKYQQIPWDIFFRTVILPIFGDALRIVVMHPLNVDLKQLRKRGLTDALTKCQLEDTVAMAYIYDDNLPHGLKELAYCILLQTKATTHAATQREIEALRKEAKPIIKETIDKVWEFYREHRQKSPEVEIKIDPALLGWQRLAMGLPPGLIKNTSAKTGRQGVVDLVGERVANVIQADYDRRAYERFARYGAEDAIYTLMLRYNFVPTFTAKQREHLDLETRVTHPCVTEMEERGLKIDIPLLEDIATAMRAAFAALQDEVVALWTLPTDAEPFNWNSNDQVARRLWNDWRLNPPPWTKNRDGSIKPKHRRAKDGLCKGDALILEALALQYEGTPYGEAIKKLLDLRGWEKLIGTYVEPILQMAKNDPDGRIHSSFWPTGARSGRFSCVAGWTELYTDAGERPIRDISVGDRVWTHEERWRPVLAKIVKGVDRMYDVRLSTGAVLTCTDSHRFLTSRMDWVTLGEIREHFKGVDIGREERAQGAEALQREGVASHRQDCGQARHHSSQRRTRPEAEHAREGAQDSGEVALLSGEVRRQAPHERADRSSTPQLDRGVRRRERLLDHHAQRETTPRSPGSHGGGARVGRATEVTDGASHRRRQEEQQPGQLGARYAQGSHRYSLFAGRGLPLIEVEEINYRGRCTVYDIAVEEDESYQAAGVFSHNSSDPNVENIPRASTMPTIEVQKALRIFGLSDPANPPRGFVVVKPKKGPDGKDGPIKKWQVRSLRQIFIPAKGFVLISADESQIENRFTAFESRDPTMLDLYRRWDCILPKTWMLTESGFRQAQEIAIGERVLSADGKFHDVVKAWSKPSRADVVTIYPYGWTRGIEVTADHRMLVMRSGRREWVAAGKLVAGDELHFPRPRIGSRLTAWRGQTITPEFCRFLGYFAGDGSLDGGPRGRCVATSFGETAKYQADYIRLVARLFGRKVTIDRQPPNQRGRFGSRVLADGLRAEFYDEHGVKRIPLWVIINVSDECLREFVVGLMRTDGCVTRQRCSPVSVAKFGQVSSSVAQAFFLACARLGLHPSVDRRRQTTTSIEGRSVSGSDWWMLRFAGRCNDAILSWMGVDGGSARKRHRSPQWRSDGAFLTPIRKIKRRAHRGMVYDFAVEGVHSFTMPWATAHNCFECKTTGLSNSILHSCPKCGAKEGKRDKSKADQPVIKGFVHGKDIHSATAAYLGFFEKYGAEGRQQAKPVNHAATYGMGANTFMRREGGTIQEAEGHLRGWHRTYPYIRGDLDRAQPGTLHQRVHEDITERGEVVMFDGHKRRFNAQRLLLRSGNFRPYEWEGTIREGVNVKMQGGTGVGMKRAMLAIRAEIIRRGWWGKVFLVNQVHDELLYEVHESIAKEFFAIVCHEMEVAFPELDVPILAEGGISSANWEAAHA